MLFPFAIIYDGVTTLRNFFFDIEIFKHTTFQLPIIVVGNLSVGGTGKTPQIEYLIRLLKDQFKIAVLSRGYKRKTEGYVLLNDTHSALEVGDEPLQFFKKFNNINVAVDANRVEGVTNLITKKNPQVILLDDAFQHRKIKGSFYILLTKYDDLFVEDFLLPMGYLRESSKGAKRANLIVVTKCPPDLSMEQQHNIKIKLRKFKKEVFFTTITYGKIKSEANEFFIDEIKNHQILLITGIANPNPLLSFLNDNSINFKHLKYKDHHNFSSKEKKQIQNEYHCLETKKKLLLTTEKDYTRLKDFIKGIYYIEIETRFLDNQSSIFNNHIFNHIKQNRC